MKKKIRVLALTLALCTMCSVPAMAKTSKVESFEEQYVMGNDIKKNINSQKQSVREKELNDIIENLKKSELYNNKNFQIRVVPSSEIKDEKKYIFAKNSSEVIRILEKDEKAMENSGEALNTQKFDAMSSSLVRASKSRYRTVHRGLVRGIGVMDYTLSADITYNTSNQVISSVKNRYFRVTGLTISTQVENKRYGTYYSPSKKYVKITCNYTAVSKIVTPVGAIEIRRKDAFQQFKWNVSKGVYEGKGGYGRADSSF